MYIKIASIIEILLGLIMGGLGGFLIRVGSSSSAMGFPEIIGFFIFGVPMIFLSIFLIIFGINLWQLKKWAWLASVVTLAISVALFTVLGLGYPICFLGSVSAIICLILLILGKISPTPSKDLLKSVRSIINKNPKITILIIVILAIAGICYFYKIPQQIFSVEPSEPTPHSEITQSLDLETVSPETIPPGYKIYKHEIYGYDMIFSETPILEVIVFNDQNENGVMDFNEKGLQNIHLDESWGDMVYLGGTLTPENGVVNFHTFPLYQKITIFLPTASYGKYWGWQTVLKEGWPVTTTDKYEFTLTEIPKETKTIYFGLKKIEEPTEITPSPEAALPSPPTNLSCEGEDGQVILGWNNPDSPDFSHIHIYRSTDNQQLGELVYDNVIAESLTDKGLTNSLQYYYTLRAVDTLDRESVSAPGYIFTCIGRPSLKISEYEIYQNEEYGYDMISSQIPILKVVVFDDQNENRRKDAEEEGLEAVHLNQYWNDEFFGKSMTPENGVVNFFELPLYQKITIIPSKDGWLISNIDRYKHEFTLSEIPKAGITAYFGLSSTRSKIECNKTDFKMAFILLVQNLDEVTEERLNTLNRIKEEFSYYFPQATRNLVSLDTNDDIYIMRTEEGMCDPNCGNKTTRVFSDRIAKKFYETHNDIYDFISVYTTFETPKINMHHTTVIQNTEGIGQAIFDNSEHYGSERVLRGINFMRDIDSCSMMYGDSLSELGPMYGLLHETGHQWCCYVGDNFARGQNDAKLEIIQQNIHFYAGLQSACETRTAMGARKWVSNNGAFKQELEEKVELWKYHPFQLYFMGLLSEEEYDIKFQIYDAGYNENWNIENAVPYKQIGVRDIIEVEGERICVP